MQTCAPHENSSVYINLPQMGPEVASTELKCFFFHFFPSTGACFLAPADAVAASETKDCLQPAAVCGSCYLIRGLHGVPVPWLLCWSQGLLEPYTDLPDSFLHLWEGVRVTVRTGKHNTTNSFLFCFFVSSQQLYFWFGLLGSIQVPKSPLCVRTCPPLPFRAPMRRCPRWSMSWSFFCCF